jgi:hypothetical protein
MTSWTTPRTWVAAETVGATTMNSHVRDNLNHLSEQISRAAWTSFTPAWTSLTVGSGTNTGWKAYAGKTTLVRVEFTYGAGSAVGSDPRINFPETAATHLQLLPVGQALLVDDSTSTKYKGLVIFNNTADALITVENASGTYVVYSSVTATVPFTWTTSDKILLTLAYERA